jgi:hypothetical protein
MIAQCLPGKLPQADRESAMEILSYVGGIIKACLPFLIPWFLRSFSGVRFTSPVDHGTVTNSQFVATWKYRWLLGMRLAVFHVEGDRFWPQGAPTNDPIHKSLSKDVSIGDHLGQQYTLVIAAVSDDVRVAIRHYVDVNNFLWDECHLDTYFPLTIEPNDMPPGILELDRVIVTLQSPHP